MAVYTTDDVSATEISDYTKCSSDFYDSGFKALTSCKGQYLILMRDGPGMSGNWLTINEIRAYSVPNLLEGANVIESPAPKDPLLDVNNLIENFETRSGR